VVEWIIKGKPSILGFCSGAVAGLVDITPACGFVDAGGAVLIGIAAGVVCYYAVGLKNKLQWDDALDVWGVHGVGGALGVIMLGVFANKLFNPASGSDGLVLGNSAFFMKELGAVTVAAAYAFAFTYAMLAVINKITPVKVTAAAEELGLDETLHGERAYL